MTSLSNPLDSLGQTQGVPSPSMLDQTQPAQGGRDTTYRPAYLTWTDPDSGLPMQFYFDCVKEESHVRDAMICEHTVEQGVDIVDHVRPQPDELTIEGIITNHPIGSPDSFIIGATINIPPPKLQISESLLLDMAAQAVGLAPKFPTSLVVNVEQFTAFTDYVANAYSTLSTLREQAVLLTAITPRAMYTNMVLKSIRMTRSTAIGAGAANFRLDLREIRIVSSAIGAAPSPTIAASAPVAHKAAQNTSENADDPPKRTAALEATR